IVETRVAHVAHDSDDRAPLRRLLWVEQAQPPADRALARKEALRQRAVEDDDFGRVRSVALLECAAGDELGAERPEVIGSGADEVGKAPLGGDGGTPLEIEARDALRGDGRQRRGAAGGRHTWQAADLREHAREERGAP